MKSYGQFCPVAKASEIFAERWTPLIIRELIMGCRRFNELQFGLPHIPRSLLVQRLRSLEDAGVLERGEAADGKKAGERVQRECPAICLYYNMFYAGVDIADTANNFVRFDHKACASKGKSRSYMRVVFALLGFSVANANRVKIVYTDRKLRAQRPRVAEKKIKSTVHELTVPKCSCSS